MKGTQLSLFDIGPETAPERNPRLITAAFHEAGHAVLALAAGRMSVKIAVGDEPEENRYGFASDYGGEQYGPPQPSVYYDYEMMILLAGFEAELLTANSQAERDVAWDHSDSDVDKAIALATKLHGDAWHDYYDHMGYRAHCVLRANLDALYRLAHALLAKSVLRGTEIRRACGRFLFAKQVLNPGRRTRPWRATMTA